MIDLTPIERHGAIYIKRDDLFTVAGSSGGKARTCWHLAQGAAGLVTASSRSSPQIGIVARIAAKLGIPCRAHMPGGPDTPEMFEARRLGAVIVPQRPGHNSVIIYRARMDAQERGWANIPFGMECAEAVQRTKEQVRYIPRKVNRIVVPVGSGMSLSGILLGILESKRRTPVLGVVVGASPFRRLDKWAPPMWRAMVELIPAGSDYHEPAAMTTYEGVQLDPYYEAKCLPFIRKNDLLWVVGIRGKQGVG